MTSDVSLIFSYLVYLDIRYLILEINFNIRFSRYGFESFSRFSGDSEIRTRDPLLARQVLSQLSYAPI